MVFVAKVHVFCFPRNSIKGKIASLKELFYLRAVNLGKKNGSKKESSDCSPSV